MKSRPSGEFFTFYMRKKLYKQHPTNFVISNLPKMSTPISSPAHNRSSTIPTQSPTSSPQDTFPSEGRTRRAASTSSCPRARNPPLTTQPKPARQTHAKQNKPTPPRSDHEASPTSAVSKIQAPAPLYQQSKGGRINSCAKLAAAAAARRHASPPISRSSAASETGRLEFVGRPHQSASSTKRSFPLSDLRRALRRRHRRHRRRHQDAKWRSRFRVGQGGVNDTQRLR